MKICVSILFILTISFAQQAWFRTYGGASWDWGFSVQQTSDGGYIVAGCTESFGAGDQDFYLIKTDSLGDTIWTRTYGGSGGEMAQSVKQTADGGYIITGGTGSYGYSGDVYLVKTNASGDTIWTRAYGGMDSDWGSSGQQTSDGGYIIAGTTYSFGAGYMDVYLIKTDSLGDTLWTRTYGGTNFDNGYSVQQTLDGGYIITGWTDSYGSGGNDVFLVKTNGVGDTIWTRTYGGAESDQGFSVQQTTDRGYIITGETQSYGAGGGDVYLIKTDSAGDTIWTRTYEGTDGECGYSVQQTTDGGYIITGETYSYEWEFHAVYLIKTNASGNLLWSRDYAGSYANFFSYSVQQTSDGGYIVTGIRSFSGIGQDDVLLFKTDTNGYSPWRVEEGKGCARSLAIELKGVPNPFISFARIPGYEREDFILFDITGKMVGKYKGEKIGDNLSAGVYFVAPQNKNISPLRIVKVR